MGHDAQQESARRVRAWPGFARSQDIRVKDTECKHSQSCSGRLDWKPLIAAFHDALEWALDIAADFAREYPDEVAVVERMRAFMRLRVAGWPVEEPSFD